MKHRESELQRACVKWFRHQYPKHEKVLFAIPNGGGRSKIEGGILKGEGVVKGVADMFLMVQPGIFLEFKTDTGLQSEDQKIFQEMAIKMGFQYRVVRNIDTFMEIINNYL